jgi:hypothetical protein
MSKPARIPTRPDAEQSDQVDPETARILAERLERDEPSEPWPVVKKRILESRRPAP